MMRPQSVDDILSSTGLSISEFYAILGKESYDSSVYKLSDSSYQEYRILFEKLKAAKSGTKQAKGKALEDIVAFLLEHLGIYEICRNKRTSTNEIDVLLVKKVGFDYLDSERFPNQILCECKYYGRTISVTYVGKFFSLLSMSRTPVGFMFSYEEISGRSNWCDAKGLCRKIALRDNTMIININFRDLEKIYNSNVSILKIIDEKITSLKQDVEFTYDNHELCKDSSFCSSVQG